MKFNPECGGKGKFEQGKKWDELSFEEKWESLKNRFDRSGGNSLSEATREILENIHTIPPEQLENLSPSLQNIVEKLAKKLEKGE